MRNGTRYIVATVALIALVGVLAVDIVSMRSPWSEADQGADGWWVAGRPLTSTHTYFEMMEQLDMRPDRQGIYAGITLGLAMHDVSDGPVPRLIVPEDMGDVAVRGPGGELVVPSDEYLGLAAAGDIDRQDYEVVLPTASIARFWEEGRAVRYPWSVHRIVAEDPEGSFVLFRDHSRANLFIVPESLAPTTGER